MIKKWDDLPEFMKTPEVEPYWRKLYGKRKQLLIKRTFDIGASIIMLIPLSFPMAVIAIMIKKDSNGPVLYRQERVTTYGKRFKIHKFRTMISDADKIGSSVTVSNDTRITKVGAFLRKYKLDELPQLFDVISGNMSFVGTRPEATKYVMQYKPEYNATLLMPAGITSTASIMFKDENRLIDGAKNVDTVYMEEVLPQKMKWNLKDIENYSVFREVGICIKTVVEVFTR